MFKKDASGVEFIEMAEDEKTKKTILVGLATKLMKRIQRCSQREKLTAQFIY